MNSTRIFVMDALCYAHIPAEFSGSGALGRETVGSVLMSQFNVGHYTRFQCYAGGVRPTIAVHCGC